MLFPTGWIINNKNKFKEVIVGASSPFSLYWAFSENTRKAQNKNSIAISDAYREAGVMAFLSRKYEKRYVDYVPKISPFLDLQRMISLAQESISLEEYWTHMIILISVKMTSPHILGPM